MPKIPSEKRQGAARLAWEYIHKKGLTRAEATRRLVAEGYYDGRKDYPSRGWLTALLRDEARRRIGARVEGVPGGGEPDERVRRQPEQGGGESSDTVGGELPAPEQGGDRTGFEENEEGATVWSKSTHIRTLEQLLEACAVDTSVWQVDHYVINTWESAAKLDTGVQVTTLYQVKAWLKRRKDAPLEDALKDLIERLARRAHRRPAPRYRRDNGEYLVVPNLYDLHMNKRSVDGTYTIQQAASDFCAVADAAVARILTLGMPVARIMLPSGNDALHTDNLVGTTTSGTVVETTTDQRDAVDALISAYEYVIERFAILAPVDVMVIESNHDRYSIHWLGRVLDALFRRTPHITIDATRGPRKYYRYGATLLGLEHGDKVRPRDLAALMASEAPQLWAETRYREWLRGHFHHAAGMYYPLVSDGGVTVRVIPALCPADMYHVLHGFVGSHRAAEILYYHQKYGPAGGFPVFVDEVAHERVEA